MTLLYNNCSSSFLAIVYTHFVNTGQTNKYEYGCWNLHTYLTIAMWSSTQLHYAATPKYSYSFSIQIKILVNTTNLIQYMHTHVFDYQWWPVSRFSLLIKILLWCHDDQKKEYPSACVWNRLNYMCSNYFNTKRNS